MALRAEWYSATLAPYGHNIRLTAHSWDPQLSSARPSGVGSRLGFVGDYFGNTTSGSLNYLTFVSTYDDGSNPSHYQQRVVAKVTIP